MKKGKNVKIIIIALFLLLSFSSTTVFGSEKIKDINFSTCDETYEHYSNTIYNVPFNKENVISLTRWCFEDDTVSHEGERTIYFDNISTSNGIDDFEDGLLTTPMPFYGDTDFLSIDDSLKISGNFSAKLHSINSFKEVCRDFKTPFTKDGTIVKASIKIDRQNPTWHLDHADIVLDEYSGSGDHEILCVRFMDNLGIYEYQNPENKIFDYWLTDVIYDVKIALNFTTQTADITVEFSWDGHPPEKPCKPSGLTNIKKDTEYEFITTSFDVDGDKLYYVWDWGGGTTGSYTWGVGPFDSAVVASANHSWDATGTYYVRVKAIDENGAQSKWSDPLTVKVEKSKPRFKNCPFLNSNGLFLKILQKLNLKLI